MSSYDNVEAFAESQGWVVKYAADGTPNFFFPIPQFKSSDMDASMPDHIHPMFKINGNYVSRRLIGVFKGADFGGACHSIPGVKPLVSLGFDQLAARVRATGTGFSPITIADWGGLMLLARKLGKTTIKGNNNYGADYRDGTRWAAGASITAGTQHIWNGVLYTALVDHTSANENKPGSSMFHWREERRVGGIMAPNNENTLTGTGPASWRFGGKANGIDDLTGNTCDSPAGVRFVGNEIQIIPDNDAADPRCDYTASSSLWKAILPNANNDGHTLVAPGTAGTLKLNWLNNKITLDTETDLTILANKNNAFKDVAINTTHLPYVPAIVRELGIIPLAGDTVQGTFYHYFGAAGDERLPRRGGHRYVTSFAGLGFASSYYVRSYASVTCGVRPGFDEELESGN